MTETLTARWVPGSTDRILVRSPHGELEWHLHPFEAIFGKAAVASLYLTGRARMEREAEPQTSTPSAA